MRNKRIIKKNHEFQSIISKKRSMASSNFILYFDKNVENIGLRYGISVGKKIGNAVVRNHVKREVRMMLSKIIKSYGDINYSVIILVRKRFTYRTFDINMQSLESLFKDLKKQITK